VAGGCEAAGVTTRRCAGRATDREVLVVAAVLDAGSEKAAAQRLGLSHSTVKQHLASARAKVGAETTAQLVWILAPRLSEPDGEAVLSRAIDSMGAEREDGIL
jgi:DNA-binding NarL/FixJ family response regulator